MRSPGASFRCGSEGSRRGVSVEEGLFETVLPVVRSPGRLGTGFSVLHEGDSVCDGGVR